MPASPGRPPCGGSATRCETAAGGVVYRRSGERVEVLIAEQCDRISGGRTVRLPKGKVDEGETLEETALREVREETGVDVSIEGTLGESRYGFHKRKKNVDKRVHYFLMRWRSGEPEPLDGEMERVFWCPIEEAGARLTYETERRPMELARQRLAGGAPS